MPYKMDEVDLKFLGFYLLLGVLVIVFFAGIREAVAPLMTLAGGVVRDLYRKDTNSGKSAHV